MAGIPPLYHSFDLPYTCPIMHTSSGSSRSSGLRIGGSFTEEPNLGQTGEGSGRPAIVVDRVPLAGPPSQPSKGKSKVNEIRYLGGSDYLGATVQNAKVVGLSRSSPFLVIPSPLATGPPLVFLFGASIFSLLTLSKCRRWFASLRRPSRTTSAFLCIPLSKASYNILTSIRPNFPLFYGAFWSGCWSSLGIKVPSIALLLDFFNVKEATEGFLYISKRSNAKLIILDLPSSHKH